MLPYKPWSQLVRQCKLLSQWPMHYPAKFDADILSSPELPIFLISHYLKTKIAAAAILYFQVMWIWPFRCVDSVVFELCTKFGSNVCHSHWDRRTYDSDFQLMTSRELTSGFDFWSRGHLRVAMVHLHMTFGADIFIQSGVIALFPKFKMAAVAMLDFQIMWICPFRPVDSVAFVFCTKFGSNICYSHWDRRN